ncbi:YceI family protein [Bdellovibrionota bacterium FG-1]
MVITRLKNILLGVFFAAFFAVPASAADYTVDASHSSVGFSVRHLVSKVKGGFSDFDGTFKFDAKNPKAVEGKFVVKIASLSTNNQKRDEHLKGPDFFDAAKFPEMTLANLKLVQAGGKDKFKMTGDLTLHGVTKPVMFALEFNGTSPDPWGNTRAGFSATGQINRDDFGISWNKALDAGGLMLGKDVTIDLQVEAIEAKPAAKK